MAKSHTSESGTQRISLLLIILSISRPTTSVASCDSHRVLDLWMRIVKP
jgi:hypothetical protein